MEIEDEEFFESAIDNFSEMMEYIVQRNLYTGFTGILLVRCGLG